MRRKARVWRERPGGGRVPGFTATGLGEAAPLSQGWVDGMDSGPRGGQAGHGPRAHEHASARSLGLEGGWVCGRDS